MTILEPAASSALGKRHRVHGTFEGHYEIKGDHVIEGDARRPFRVNHVVICLSDETASYGRYLMLKVTVSGPRILTSGKASEHRREHQQWASHIGETPEKLPDFALPAMQQWKADFRRWRHDWAEALTPASIHEWKPCGTCERCGVELFTNGIEVTDTWNNAHCVAYHPNGWQPNPHIRQEEK